MLGFASTSILLLAGMLAGGSPAAKKGESPARDQPAAASGPESAQGDETMADASEPLSDEETASQERRELRILMSPYDLASFYRSGGTRGLYGASPEGSLSSFYRAAPSAPSYWRVAPGPFLLRARRGPGTRLETWPDEELLPSEELGLSPYSPEPAKVAPDKAPSHPKASSARRRVEDSNREQ